MFRGSNCRFVDVPAGSNFVKKHVFVMFKGFTGVKNSFICMVLSLRSVPQILMTRNESTRLLGLVEIQFGGRVLTNAIEIAEVRTTLRPSYF